jgi:hypothetical protein
MSQVGRISGPLLFANLERNGIDLAFETDLIYLDVTGNKIGIRNASPSNEIQILDTTRTVSLIADTQANIANFDIQTTTIQPFPGDVILDARYKITSSNVKTDDIFIDDNYISTTNNNSILELRPNGTGQVEVFSNLEVDGDIHADGNITLEGNITFGDALSQDTVTFDTDVTSDINPNTTVNYAPYDLGKADKRWLETNTRLANVSRINATDFALGGVDLTLSPGKTFYVAKNGDNDSNGEHIQAPFETIDYALTQVSAGDTVYVLPGEYEESCPLVVPAGVTVTGHDIRNTIITPPSSSSSRDIFHLNGETTVQNFTIKDFFYDSGNDVGYAFRFAPSATVTSRSPYVQNITVSTQGSTTSASDPRGYASADAGKGALVDGASVLGTSNEASMLFHAVTFITPGVDALTMTNGVRVEWLNSFTYFADKGMYAVNGSTGHLSTDGSTILYGAELRSIGSANVYGNKGAVADGDDTLMYLIQHNFGYIGAGKFVDNDPSRAIQANETEELNSGTIYFSSTDHLGNFRVGEQFFVDLDTGNSTLTIDESTVDSLAGLTVTTNGNIAIIDATKIQNQNIRLSGNTIESLSGGMTIDSPVSTFINLNGDTSLTGNLDITNNFTFDGTLSLAGNQPTDTVTFNTEFSQDLEPNQHDTFTLGKEDKRWNFAYVNDADLNGITIETNVITTTDSNADLELRPNGTGKVNITDDVGIGNDITVGGTSTFQNLQVATIDVDADITATDFTIRNFDIQGNLGQLGRTQFENIVIDDNFISTTVSNSDLELRAAGTGEVTTDEFVRINNTLFNESTTTTGPVTISGQTTFTTLTTDDITINSNSIQVNNTNQDLIIETFPREIFTGTIERWGGAVQTGGTISYGSYRWGYDGFNTNGVYPDPRDSLVVGKTYNLTFTQYNTGKIIKVPRVYKGYNYSTSDIADINSFWFLNTNSGTPGPNDFAIRIGWGSEDGVNGNAANGGRNPTGWRPSGAWIAYPAIIEFFEVTNQDGDVKINTSDVVIEENLTVEGSSNFADLNVIGSLQHTGDRTQTGNYNIAGEITNEKILIEDNFITTYGPSLDLQIKANGTGEIYIPSNVQFDNDLTVQGTSTFSDMTVNGTFQPGFAYITGDRGFTGNLTITENLTVDQKAQFEEILIDDNFITTTSSNADLELRARNAGVVLIPNNDVEITNNLSVANAQVVNVNIAQDLVLNELIIPPSIIEIDDNFISTRISNADLDLRADGNGNIVFTDNTTITDALNVNTLSTLDDVEITGITNINGNTTFTNDYTVTGQLTTDKLVLTENYQDFEKVGIYGNKIISQESNTDLELRASGTGRVVIDDAIFSQGTTAKDLTATNIVADQDFFAEVIDVGDIEIFDNVITTSTSNSDLELRANADGEVIVEQPLDITNGLTVNDTATLNTFVQLDGQLDITGDIIRTGNTVTQPGHTYSVDGAITINPGNLDLVKLSNFAFNQNQVLLQTANDLTLNAIGTGNVVLTDTIVSQDMSAISAAFGSLRILDSFELENMVSSTDIEIFDNVITTTNSNSDLELRAQGNVEIDNNFNVTGNTVVTGATSLQDTDINANLNITANVVQTGNRTISSDVSVTNLIVDRQTDLGNFTFEDNTITNNNAGNLTFTAPGTGNVIIEQGKVDNNLSAASASASDFVINNIVTANKFVSTDDIEIFQNVITTTNNNSDLELRTSGSGTVFIEDLEFDGSYLKSAFDITIASDIVDFDAVRAIRLPAGDSSQRIVASVASVVLDGGNGVNDPQPLTVDGGDAVTVFGPTDTFYDAGTSLEPNGNPGDMRFNTDFNLFEGFSQANKYFGGVFSEDAQTNVQALNDEVEFRVAGTKVGSVAYDGVNITTALQTTNITISDNIVTSENNTALQLVPNGAGKVKFFNNTAFDDNKIQNLANDNSLTLASTDDGYIKINTTVNGFVIPVGDDSNRGATPVVGELRYNTEAGDEGGAEVYNGTEWVSVAGDNSQADALVIGEAIDEWTLILG